MSELILCWAEKDRPTLVSRHGQLGSGLCQPAFRPRLDSIVQSLPRQGQYGGCRRHTLPRRSLLLEQHIASHTALISI